MKKKLYRNTAFLSLLCALTVLFTKCQKKSDEPGSKNQQTTESSLATSKNNPADVASALCTPTGSNHYITKDVAKKMIDKYQEAVRRGTVSSTVTTAGWTNAETFTGNDVRRLLAQPNCCNFRIYYGLGVTDNRMHAILVGTAPGGYDLFSYSPTVTAAAATEPPPIIIEAALPCPQICIGVYPN
jgi:hypothetical protein